MFWYAQGETETKSGIIVSAMARFPRLIVFALLLTSVCGARVSWTGVAAGTTIAVNALSIRETSAKALKAWRATRKAAVKAARKVAGK